ncbi:MAG: phosphatase PAP2 family protein [Alloprevotella sp.]|nr:phosphatase PAP2 family protein [Alloprevotella sp.]
MLETLQNIDDAILLAVNGLHTPFLDEVMWAISGRFIWIPLYAFLLFYLYKRTGWRKTLLWIIGIALIILITDQICIHVFRHLFTRMRPSNPDNPISPFVHLVRGYHSGRYGFPSAHAANTWALVCYLGLILRKKALTCTLAGWAALVCYSRMYLGVHYLGDLLGGLAFGATVATLLYYSISYLDRRFQLTDQTFHTSRR